MKNTYTAVQVTKPGRFEIVERDILAPAAGQVRIRVEACGVCHTDALTVEGGIEGLAYPRVPGHEVVGRIEALGESVLPWRVGQRVGVGFMAGPCGYCEPCRRGQFINCQNQRITGIHHDGGYAETMIAGQSGLVSVPGELSSAEAAPLLCAGVTTFNALKKSPARPGELVAIQGVGGLGHLAIQFARHMGFRTVAIARGADKAQAAKALGAHRYIDSQAEDPAQALQALGGASVILTTITAPGAMAPLLGGLGPEGQLIVVGAGNEPLPVPVSALLFGQHAVVGSNTGSTIENEDNLRFSVLQDIRARIETVPLREAPRAYARMMRNEARFRMVLTMD